MNACPTPLPPWPLLSIVVELGLSAIMITVTAMVIAGGVVAIRLLFAYNRSRMP